jgi:hypothetical protein
LLPEKAKSLIQKAKLAKSAAAELVPKPRGRRSRDFNIFDAMNAYPERVQVTKASYNNLIVSQSQCIVGSILVVVSSPLFMWVSTSPSSTGASRSPSKPQKRLEM